MKKRLYVAYGSNLNLWQMKRRCPDAKVVGTSTIKGYELLFKGSKTGSYLTIEKNANGEVPVGVFEVSEEDERNLDMYEGYPSFYYKKEMVLPVKRHDSTKTFNAKVFVYIMHESRLLGIPSKFYLETCLEGYRDFGFDSKFLKNAYHNSIDKILNNVM